MGKALELKLDGHLDEFLSDCQAWGIWEALEKWHLPETGSTYLRARKIGTEVTKDENFGLHPRSNAYVREGIRGTAREFVASFADYVIKMDRRSEQMKKLLGAYKANGKEVEREFVADLADLTDFMKSHTPA